MESFDDTDWLDAYTQHQAEIPSRSGWNAINLQSNWHNLGTENDIRPRSSKTPSPPEGSYQKTNFSHKRSLDSPNRSNKRIKVQSLPFKESKIVQEQSCPKTSNYNLHQDNKIWKSSDPKTSFDDYPEFEIDEDDLEALFLSTSTTYTEEDIFKSSSNMTNEPTLAQGIWHNVNGFDNECLTDSDIEYQSSTNNPDTLQPYFNPLPFHEVSSDLPIYPAPTASSNHTQGQISVQHELFQADSNNTIEILAMPKPFLRPKFPPPLRDRSVLLGVTPETSLRICFRIGEAINVGVSSLRKGIDVVIELYARVAYSSRPSNEQSLDSGDKFSDLNNSSSPRASTNFKRKSTAQVFLLHDLFHSHPPYLRGTYDLWLNSELWDRDSRVFLHNGGVNESPEPRLCRCIGRIKRETDRESKEPLVFVMLSVLPIEWVDVESVKQLVFESAC